MSQKRAKCFIKSFIAQIKIMFSINLASFVVIIYLVLELHVFSEGIPLCNISMNVNYSKNDCNIDNEREIELFEYRLDKNDYFLDENEEETLYPDEYYYYDFFNEYDHENNSFV